MKMSLKTKILIAFLSVGLIPLFSVALYSYSKSSDSLQSEALAKLEAIKNLKLKAVENYFALIKRQVLLQAHNESMKNIFSELNQGFTNYLKDNNFSQEYIQDEKKILQEYYQNQFSKEYSKQNEGKIIDVESLVSSLTADQMALQIEYIAKNTHPLGSKHLLNQASGIGKYDKFHSQYHPNIREYSEKFELYDIFLIDAKSGNVIYSVYKELDFGTSLRTGPYKDSGLANAFRKALDLNDPEAVVMEDYEVYRPSYDGPAGFIATPIWINGEKKGVIAFQISFDKINSITLEKTGEEKTLETYLVGSDFKMRSDTVLDKANRNVRSSFRHPEKGSLKTESIQKALSGQSKTVLGEDYFKVSSLESYGPVSVLGNQWAIQSIYRTEEALAPVAQLRKAFLISGIIFVILISAFALWFDKAVVSGLINAIAKVADHLREEAEVIKGVSQSSAEVSGKLSEATSEQAASVQETVASIDEIAAMVTRNADSAVTSSTMSEQSTKIAQKGKEKAELMMSSIKDIATENDEMMKQIQHSNKEFAEIVNVINGIAQKTQVINDIVFQTKLLSFNASVEAARAGENGKGFAVVAEEVGNLASMSGNAATEITAMLETSVKRVTSIVDESKRLMDAAIQRNSDKINFGATTSKECMSALDEILVKVSTVNEMIREISTASKEQSTGIREINKAMSEMDQVTQSNSAIAQESSRSSRALQAQVERLNMLVIDLAEILGKKPGTNDTQSNVVKMPVSKDVSKVLPREASRKVQGLSVEVPNQNDSRFEDV